MSWGKQKSRVSLRNLLRNKKTAVIAAVCCVVAVGVYIGFHRPTSKADDQKPIRGIINDLSEIEGKKAGGRTGIGKPDNPFVILEIVPYQHYTSMSYMVEGCFPYDVLDVFTGTSAQGLNNMNVGNALEKCFTEEEHPKSWKLMSGNVELNGYYEKVAGTPYGKNDDEGRPGIDAAQFDVTRFEDGKPVFEPVGEGEGDYIWVTLGCAEDRFKAHASRENAVWNDVDSLDAEKSIESGDRYYTIRKENEYYDMGNEKDAEAMFRHYNDMMRYSLRNMVHTKYDMDNFSIVVKPIEPQELNENPQWIDYADFIYIHPTNEMPYSEQIRGEIVKQESAKIAEKGGTAEAIEEVIQEYSNIKSNSTTFPGYEVAGAGEDPKVTLKEKPTFGYFGNGEWSRENGKQNDISWEVAEKLFFKANALDMYDGSQKDPVTGMDLTYAPVVIAANVFQSSLDSYEKSDNTGTKNLDYMTMIADPASDSYNTGYNNNFYKFALMSLLMNQDVFYDLFFSPVDSTGKPTIQSVNGEGICAGQTTELAQKYWNPYTFLPYNNNSGNWKAYQEKYKILSYDDDCKSFLAFEGNKAVWQYTYVYNSDGAAFYLADKSEIMNNKYTSEAFKWYEEVENDPHSSLSAIDVFYYLLNYNKNGNNNTGSRTKNSIKVLEIEPSNDFLLTESSLKALFPTSEYKMEIEPPVHMTTAEFNGSKIELSEYDMVYIGTCRGKMNTEVVQNMAHGYKPPDLEHGFKGGEYDEEDARYNDANLIGKLYLHVGDSVKSGNSNYRLSGTDITEEKVEKLKDYVNSNNVLVFEDFLYNHAYSNNPMYQRNVDVSSNMHRLITEVAVDKNKNVVNISDLKKSNKIVSTEIQGAAVTIISTPKPYVNIMKSDKKEDTAKASINGNKLTFKFEIGYPGDKNVEDGKNMNYGVRLYVDINGDGIISDAEDGSEIIWDSVKKGAVYPAGTKEKPGSYSIDYTIDEERKNGAIAWKFEVFSTDNENIKTVVSGVSRYNGYEEDDQKVKNRINVLQIISTEEYNKSSSKANLQKELTKVKNKNNKFAYYAKDLDDYEITVTTIPLKKSGTTIDKMGYLDAFKHVNSDEYDTTSNSRENFSSGGDYYYPSEYMKYGVYLFSCGKEFEKADNSNGAVAFASWLSENGRSVIYTADSIYDADNAAVNGVAKLLKDSAGLSRYTSSSNSTKEGNDVATYDKNSRAEMYASDDYNGYRNLEYTYNKLTETGQAGEENSYLPFKNETWKKKDGSAVSYGSKTDSTDTLSQINKGTVCVYPYTITDPGMDILDRFENQVTISGCTSQDYQLNLNYRMANVWYCLSGKEDTTYGISPNDAWNNYYLYNVDNVFYDGISLESGGTTELEMQLFINVLIRAYEASYKHPYITADKLKILPVAAQGGSTEATPSPEELKIELLDTSDEERNYQFSVSGVNSQFVEDYRYKEYKAGAAPIVNVSAAPTPTQAPIPMPTQDSNATPEPTAAPTATPITLFENPLGGTGEKMNQNVKEKDGAWMVGLPNDTKIQIAYRSSEKIYENTNIIELRGGKDQWDPAKYFKANDYGNDHTSTNIQTITMTIDEFKQVCPAPVSSNEDLEYVYLASSCLSVSLLSVRLYGVGMEVDDPTIGTGGVSGGEDDNEDGKREKDVTGTDFLADTDTHKIYFTPYDGNLVGGNIRSVKLEYVSDKNNNENTLSQPINEVFREKKSGTQLKTYRIKDDTGTGMFTEDANRYLVDSTQYFIPYNKTYINMYGYIKMTIWNKKKSSVTYIAINDMVTSQKTTKDVYMFNLD